MKYSKLDMNLKFLTEKSDIQMEKCKSEINKKFKSINCLDCCQTAVYVHIYEPVTNLREK